MLAAMPYRTVAARARTVPTALPEAPVADATLISPTPANPTSSPTICTAPGGRRRRMVAKTAANSGTAPLIMPAAEEETPRSWAIGNRRRGIAVHTRARRTIRGQSSRATGVRLRRTRKRAAAPSAIRTSVINAGWKASRPMAIHRNEEPHISATEARSPHSAIPKASGRVPGAVDITRRATGLRVAVPPGGPVRFRCGLAGLRDPLRRRPRTFTVLLPTAARGGRGAPKRNLCRAGPGELSAGVLPAGGRPGPARSVERGIRGGAPVPGGGRRCGGRSSPVRRSPDPVGPARSAVGPSDRAHRGPGRARGRTGPGDP